MTTDLTTIHDNLYSKPTQLCPFEVNSGLSMAVLFTVHGVWYFGQYKFSTGIWTTIPGDDRSRSFPDKVVETWMYPPNSKKAFDDYASAVESGVTCDPISRIVDSSKWVLHYEEPIQS
jgi:hypothetical protein